MTTWTVVFRKSKFASSFTKTGDVFATWDEAVTAAGALAAELPEGAHVYYVATTETVIEHTGNDGITTAVRIAPSKAEKAAAKARQAKIDGLLATHAERLSESLGYSPLMGFGRRLHGVIPEVTEATVAAYCVDNGMDWAAIGRTQW